MKGSSLRNYYAVTVTPRDTVQDCKLCRFPSDLLVHMVATVRAQIASQIKAEAVVSIGEMAELIDDLDQPIVPVSLETEEKAVPASTYISLLELKLGVLSLMSTCTAIYHKTRGGFVDNLKAYHRERCDSRYFNDNEVIMTWSTFPTDKVNAFVSLFHLLPLPEPYCQPGQDCPLPVDGYLVSATKKYRYDAYDLSPLFYTPYDIKVGVPTRAPLFKIVGVRVRLYSRETTPSHDAAWLVPETLRGEHSKLANSGNPDQVAPPSSALEYFYQPEYADHPDLRCVYYEDFYPSRLPDLHVFSGFSFSGCVNKTSIPIEASEFESRKAQDWKPRLDRRYAIRCGTGEDLSLRQPLHVHEATGGEECAELEEGVRGDDGGCCGEVVARLVDSICRGADEQLRARIVARVSQECVKPPGMTDLELASMILMQFNELQ